MLELVAGADAVTFSSSSTVEGFVSGYGAGALPPVVASIGPVTTRTAGQLGVHVDVEASSASVEALVEALVGHAAAHGRPR